MMAYSNRASIYEVEYQEDRDVAFLLSFITNATNSSLLEVPCGAGRLSIFLSRASKHLTIVDMEPKMIAKAKDRIERHGVGGNVRSFVGDIRSLWWEHEFDLAIIPRESLQLLPPSEGKMALASVARTLRPGGSMIVDCATFKKWHDLANFDPDYFDPSRKGGEWKKNWDRKIDQAGTKILRRWSSQFEYKNRILFRFKYVVEHNKGCVGSWSSTMCLYKYQHEWLERYCPSGMLLKSTYGDYDRSSISKTSTRMIGVYTKIR